jgi:hypothetical protein
MVGTVVEGQLIVLAVQRELSFADTVTPATDKRGEIRLLTTGELLDTVVTLDHVTYVTVFVWHHDSTDGTTIIRDGYFETLTVPEDVQIGLLTVNGGLEVLALQTAQIHCLCSVRHMNMFIS